MPEDSKQPNHHKQRVVVFVRTAIRWNKMNARIFYSQRVKGGPGLHIAIMQKRRILDQWNCTFKIHYFAFRYMLQRIDQESLFAVNGIEVIAGLRALRREWSQQQPCIIFPIDDDDLVSPSIASIGNYTDPILSWFQALYKNGIIIPQHKDSHNCCGKSFVYKSGAVIYNADVENGLETMICKDYNEEYLYDQQKRMFGWLNKYLIQEHMPMERQIELLQMHSGIDV